MTLKQTILNEDPALMLLAAFILVAMFVGFVAWSLLQAKSETGFQKQMTLEGAAFYCCIFGLPVGGAVGHVLGVF
jgi:hypothetical protein